MSSTFMELPLFARSQIKDYNNCTNKVTPAVGKLSIKNGRKEKQPVVVIFSSQESNCLACNPPSNQTHFFLVDLVPQSLCYAKLN